VRVLDLNDRELLQDTVVKTELLLLEAGNYLLTEVDGQQIEQLGCAEDFSVVAFDSVGHAADIILVLEHCGHSLLTLLNGFDVLLGVTLFAFKIAKAFHDLITASDSISHGFNIVEFSLDPVVKINVGVSE